ncbi:MAG: hypothetical protein HY324_03875, partial [Chlamydiia bacterium]|nr:hypothetical protein [Chlamydiia bacterium]
MKRLFFFAMTFFLPLLAEELSPKPLSNSLKGIRFVNKWERVERAPELPLYTVTAEGLFLFDLYPSFLSKLQSSYIGSPLTKGTLERLETEIVEFYASKGQPFVVVSIPEQDFGPGELQVVIIEPRFGEIRYKGNKYSSPERLGALAAMQSGQPIDTEKFLRNLTQMNRTPFRRTDAMWKAGVKPGTVDLELDT